MGYTHYWTQKRDFTAREFAQITADIRRIMDRRGDIPLDIGSSKDSLWFNGWGDDAHETMEVTRKRPKLESWQKPSQRGWNFCKTAHKPYDKIVTAVLVYLAAKWGYEVSSDGDHHYDWVEGVALAREALPELAKTLVCPLKEEV